MSKELKKMLLISTGAVLFNLIFWEEKLGVNTVLFDAFIIGSIFHLYPGAKNNRNANLLLTAHIICLVMVVAQNTFLSKFSFAITLLLFAGFSQYVHRSAWFAGGSVFMNIILFVANLVDQLKGVNVNFMKGRQIPKYIRFAFFPLILMGLFFILYFFSNTIFLDLATKFVAQTERLLTTLFGSFSFSRMLFTIAGLYVVGSILLRSKINFFSEREAGFSDDLIRSKKPLYKSGKQAWLTFIGRVMGKVGTGVMALKNENTVGITSLILLNALLFIINLLDIIYVWFNFKYTPNISLYKMVHEGTDLLILSIVLAMMVLLFFFKGNLNFYKRNKWLKYAAYAWIFQNTILLISVLVRDCYYITHFGLAFKRIGLLFFLLSVMIGLITVFVKIYSRKTNYFLFRVNASALIVILVLASLVNWDETIAVYNLKHRDTVPVDWKLLLTLSDKTLPLLDSAIYLAKTPQSGKGDSEKDSLCETCYVEKLKEKEQRFISKQKKYTWLSWNLSDAFVENYFQQKSGYRFSKN